MRTITLTQGKFAIVDDEDYARLSAVKWCYSEGYAVRNAGADGFVKMHHLVIGRPPKGCVTDHKNRNGLDNTKLNLRHVTQGRNVMNKPAQKNNTSGYKGVYWHKAAQKWCAEIKADGKRKSLGLFTDKELAADAYDKSSAELHGEFGRRNVRIWLSALSSAQLVSKIL